MTCPFCTKIQNAIFYESKHSYAIYNLRPIVPGHVMIIPKKHRQHLLDLTDEESADFMQTVREVCKILKKHYNAEGLSLLIQDGEAAGQTVPHIHMHIAPLDGKMSTRKFVQNAPKSKDRHVLTDEEMKKEVDKLIKE
jgi:bis(5'-adenosyl)-triphosphatase